MKENNTNGFSFIAILIGVVIFAVLAMVSLNQYTKINPETGESKISESKSIVDNTKLLADNLNQHTQNINSIIKEDTSMQYNENDLAKIKRATLKTNMGEIVVEFYRDDAPETVENFIKLSNDNFYDGTRFHRVIKDFMIQGGDQKSKNDALVAEWGTGDPGYKFEDEFNNHKLVRGSLAMANSGPDTNGSQFFIVTADATPWLDGKHTNFGFVKTGMSVVEAIEATQTLPGDRPVEPITILDIVLE